jgi:hypothetical protein
MKKMNELLNGLREQIKTAAVSRDAGDDELSVLTQSQFDELADFVEEAGEKQAAILQIQDFQTKRAQARMTPQETAQRVTSLKQAGRRQALRNLGFGKQASRGIDPLSLLFPESPCPTLKLAEVGAQFVTAILTDALAVAVDPGQDGLNE